MLQRRSETGFRDQRWGGCAGGQGEGACCGAGATAAGFGADRVIVFFFLAFFLTVRWWRTFFLSFFGGGATGVSWTVTGFGRNCVVPSPIASGAIVADVG